MRIHENVRTNVCVVWSVICVYLCLTSPFNFGAALSAITPCVGKIQVRLWPSASLISWSAVIVEMAHIQPELKLSLDPSTMAEWLSVLPGHFVY